MDKVDTGSKSTWMESAFAKLTLNLSIVGVRDDGFHFIESEMVRISLADVVTIRDSNSTSIRLAPESRYTNVPTNQKNLIWKLLDRFNYTADIVINKQIPIGGGLGGGSADASVVLQYLKSKGKTMTDTEIAEIGADVPFCLGHSRGRVLGIGETIEPLQYEPRVFTLFLNPLIVSSAKTYAAWDKLGGPSGDNGNDLEPAAIHLEPKLLVIRDMIESQIGIRPKLAGSGSTWFVEGEHKDLDNAVVVHTVEV